MQLVYQHTASKQTRSRPIFLLCVFRDETLLLESFIGHYRALGVTHFIMIDNLSVDDGSYYLKQIKDVNIVLYRANGSYREAKSGTDWVMYCLEKYCVGQYCFTVDADELFVFDRSKYSSIHDLISDMEDSGANCIGATLLDMYPKVLNNDYHKGDSLLKHSSYFDEWNSLYYRDKAILYDKFVWRIGGVRTRVTGTTPIIQKFPFFKYDFQPLRFNTGYHFFQYQGKILARSDLIKLLPIPAVLLHFKFVKHNLLEVFKQGVANNQYWNNSSEYKLYVKALGDKKITTFYDPKYSKKLTKIDNLSLFFRGLSKLHL